MNTEQFNAKFDEIIGICRDTLCHKADEYAESDDRLHNFNVAAQIEGCKPIQALGGMMAKHTVSVYDLIRQSAAGKEIPAEMWQEKIKDSINYLILLWAMVDGDIANKRQEILNSFIEAVCDREVGRAAKAGEWIKITNACPGDGQSYKNGDKFKVYLSESDGRVSVPGQPFYIKLSEYSVMEDYNPEDT